MSFINAAYRDVISFYPKWLRFYTYWILAAVFLMLVYIIFFFNFRSFIAGRIIIQPQRQATFIVPAISSGWLRRGEQVSFYINNIPADVKSPVSALITDLSVANHADSIKATILFDPAFLKYMKEKQNRDADGINLTGSILLKRKGIFHQVFNQNN